MQQINFLHQLPKPPKYYLSDQRLFLIIGGFLGILLLITLGQSVMLGMNKYTLDKLNHSYAGYQAELDKNLLRAQSNNSAALEKELAAKRELLQTLQSHKFTSNQCAYLSYYLKAFSQTVLQGLWLTQINIDLNQDIINLKGLTYLPALPLKLIDHLQKMTCFSDRQFEAISLSRQAPAVTQAASPAANAGNKKNSSALPLLEFQLKSSAKSTAGS